MTTTTAADKEFRLSKSHKPRQIKEVVDQQTGDTDDIDVEGYECRTPTSKEHKIPVPGTCPPAPKRVRRRLPGTAIVVCKSINGSISPNNVIDSNGCSNGSTGLSDVQECRAPPPPQFGSPVAPTSVVSWKRVVSSCQVVTDQEVGNITGGTDELFDNHVKEEDDDDNDGYRTPTSLEHRIPVPTSCPAAPRAKRTRSPIVTPASAVLIFKRKIYQQEM